MITDMSTWLRKQGVPQEYHAATIEQVEASIRPKIQAYLENFRHHAAEGHGLLLTGTLGIGKTHILSLVMQAAKPSWALFVYCQDLYDCLVPKTKEQETLLWRYQDYSVLCIDGFGEAYEHDWPFSKFELLVEKRKTARKVTCMSTNLSTQDLKKNPKYGRVIDRLKTCCYTFELEGRSRRKALSIDDL